MRSVFPYYLMITMHTQLKIQIDKSTLSRHSFDLLVSSNQLRLITLKRACAKATNRVPLQRNSCDLRATPSASVQRQEGAKNVANVKSDTMVPKYPGYQQNAPNPVQTCVFTLQIQSCLEVLQYELTLRRVGESISLSDMTSIPVLPEREM